MGCGQSTEAANLQDQASNFLEQPTQRGLATSKPVINGQQQPIVHPARAPPPPRPPGATDYISPSQMSSKAYPSPGRAPPPPRPPANTEYVSPAQMSNKGYGTPSQTLPSFNNREYPSPAPSYNKGYGSPQVRPSGSGSPHVGGSKAYKPPISSSELASSGPENAAQIAANARDITSETAARGFRKESGGRRSTERQKDHKPAAKPKRTRTKTQTRPSPIVSEIAQPTAPQRVSQLPSDIVIEEAKEGETFEQVYRVGKQLGDGAFSEVVLGTHRLYEIDFAVKKIDRKKMHWGGRDALKDEIENLRKLKEAPHVVKFQDVFYEETVCYLVVELLPGGELFGRIMEKGTFSEREARDMSKCVLSALHYMHSRRIAHRDMKPENLLVVDTATATNLVKLSDFGFAKSVERRNTCRTLCGTPGYMAPEVLERWPAYDVACDMWGFGVILFLLLGGYLPFDPTATGDVDAMFERTRNGQYHFYPERWQNISHMAKDLVARCLNINPSRRLSSHRALQHPWILAGEAKISNTKIDTKRMRESITKSRTRTKKKAAAKAKKNRVKDLQDDFTVYMDKRKKDSIVSHMTGAHKTIATAATAFKEEGGSGQSIDTFYTKGRVLGKGAFAQVYRARHNRSGTYYAVKEVDLSGLNKKELKTLNEEITVLKFVRGGPGIIRLFDVFREPQKYHLVMEEMTGGDLLNRILEKEVYTENEARDCCKHFFEAVKYCHRKRIAHRDIKLDNLLLVEKGNEATLKLADFGFSRKCRSTGLTTMCGTPNYMAPEVFQLPSGGYDFRCDMWSAGVVVYCLLGGYLPFEGDIKRIKRKVLSASYKFHTDYWKNVSTPAKELIARMLEVNPDRRISAEQALRCEWMGLDEDQLTTNDLSSTQEKFKGSDKLKTLERGVLAAGKDRIDEEDEKFVEQYELLQQIGHGEFAEIHIAIQRQSNDVVAVKKVCRRTLVPSDVIALDDEIAVMRAVIDSTHVIRLRQVFEDSDYTHIVMDRINGIVLIDQLVKRKRFPEAEANSIVRSLLMGVKHCHDKRIAIRNLKLESLLLPDDDPTNVKITDFECSKVVPFPNSLRTQCGTQEYVAPEVLENKPAYDVSCDMWTVGVIVFIMLGGYYPFRGKKEIDVLKKVRYGEFKFHEKYWKGISENAKDLVNRMMNVDPEQRVTAADALISKWINSDSSIDHSAQTGELEDLDDSFSEISRGIRSKHSSHLLQAMNQKDLSAVAE